MSVFGFQCDQLSLIVFSNFLPSRIDHPSCLNRRFVINIVCIVGPRLAYDACGTGHNFSGRPVTLMDMMRAIDVAVPTAAGSTEMLVFLDEAVRGLCEGWAGLQLQLYLRMSAVLLP